MATTDPHCPGRNPKGGNRRAIERRQQRLAWTAFTWWQDHVRRETWAKLGGKYADLAGAATGQVQWDLIFDAFLSGGFRP